MGRRSQIRQRDSTAAGASSKDEGFEAAMPVKLHTVLHSAREIVPDYAAGGADAPGHVESSRDSSINYG